MRPRMNDLGPEEKELVSRVKLPRCPDFALLQAAHEGVLAEEQTTQVEEHISHCETCRTLFADLDSVNYGAPSAADSTNVRDRISRTAPAAFRPTPSPSRKGWWVAAVAFAASVAVVAYVAWPSSHSTPVASSAVAQAKPLPQITVGKLPIRVDAAALLATRGNRDASQPSGSELAKALAKYQADDYPGAVQQLKPLARKYPNDGTIRLYLGVSELLLNQNAEAAADLESATRILQGPRLSDSQWYLIAADLRLKNSAGSIPLIEELCASKSSYKDEACKLESQLK